MPILQIINLVYLVSQDPILCHNILTVQISKFQSDLANRAVKPVSCLKKKDPIHFSKRLKCLTFYNWTKV